MAAAGAGRLGALLASSALALLAGSVASASAQTPAPFIEDRSVSATCGEGRLDLTAEEEQHVPGGSAVVATDAVTEGAETRTLAAVEVALPVAVDATVPITRPVRFRSRAGGADFVFTRTTDVYTGGSAATGTYVYTEQIVARCISGSTVAVVTVTGGPVLPTTTTTARSSPSDAPPAAPVAVTPRFTA